jgi:hypothetical protein
MKTYGEVRIQIHQLEAVGTTKLGRAMQRIENLLPLVGILSLVTALKKERPLLN